MATFGLALVCGIVVSSAALWFLGPWRRGGRNVGAFVAIALIAPLVLLLASTRGDAAATVFVIFAYAVALVPIALGFAISRARSQGRH